MAYLVVQADLVIGRRLGIALATAGIDDPLHVLVGEDGVHAGECQRPAAVDIEDACMGMGAGEQAAMEHAGHLHVVGEDGAPFGQFDGVDFRLRFVDHRGLGRGQGGRHCSRARLRICTAGFDSVGPLVIVVHSGPFARLWDIHNLESQRQRFIALHLGGGAQHGLDRLRVAGAAAEHAGDGLAHLRFAGVRVRIQQVLGRQKLSRSTVAALDGPAGHKLLLERMQFFVARAAHSLNSDNRRSIGLGCQHHAAVDQAIAIGRVRLPGQQQRIGSALAGLVAMFDAEVAKTAQCCAQQFTRKDIDLMFVSVDDQRNFHALIPVLPAMLV